MNFSADAEFWLVVGCAIAMLVGLFGVIIPGLPGLTLCFAAVAVWAIFADAGNARWLVLGLSALFYTGGQLIKYLWPGKRLLASGVPKMSLFVGAVAGIIGFFAIPVIGLPLGFVAGVWGAEAYRMRGFAEAWPGTKQALQAVGLSIAIEMLFGLAITVTWILGLIFA